MSIKAIIFDYGQVISLPQDSAALDRLAELAGVTRDRFETVLWALRGEYDRGTISALEYYREILSELGVSKDEKSIKEMVALDMESWSGVNPETVTLMEDVKKAGYLLGILSNMPHEFLAWCRANVPAVSLAQFSLFSCELGLVKPEEAIYRELLSTAGVKSEELVFFDDNAENIKSALALGIRAILWKDPEDARRELSSLGVRL